MQQNHKILTIDQSSFSGCNLQSIGEIGNCFEVSAQNEDVKIFSIIDMRALFRRQYFHYSLLIYSRLDGTNPASSYDDCVVSNITAEQN